MTDSPLDDWWQDYKNGHPSLHLSDKTFDQSHFWHALLCAFAGGPIGVVWNLVLALFDPWVVDVGRAFACGVLGTVGGYLVRELGARLKNWRYRLWDGILDVLVPAAIQWPYAYVLIHGMHAGAVVLAWIAWGAVAYLYTFGRPANAFAYGDGY